MENHNEHETPKYHKVYFEAEKYLRRLGFDPNFSEEEPIEEEPEEESEVENSEEAKLENEYRVEDVVKDLDRLASSGDAFAAELKERILEGAKEADVTIKWE